MGASRKLQGEIDRVLKKVQEGVDVFDSIWNKVYDTDNANQKEKFEADLKKEIKKLQRYRDQIKTWIQSSEIKDKKVSASYEQALMDARKLIEREMERFKVCEKEFKTKAFSKEGLGQQPKTDPREKAKSETRDWLNNVVSELESQVDYFEAEIEGLSVKKGKQRPPRLTHLETSIARHKAHIMKLELILRLLDNDELSPEQVNDVKDFLDDYVERNQDDFEEFSDVDELYISLPLDKVESLEDLVTIAPPSLVKGAGTASAVLSLKTPASPSPIQTPGNSTPEQVEEAPLQDSNTEIPPRTPPSKTGGVFSSSASATPPPGIPIPAATVTTPLRTSAPPAAISIPVTSRGMLDNSSSNAIASSPVSSTKDEEMRRPSPSPSPSLVESALGRTIPRVSVPVSTQSLTTTPGSTIPPSPSSLIPSELAKRNTSVTDERIAQTLASPLTNNRVLLTPIPKSTDVAAGSTDSNNISEPASIGGRPFSPSVVPGVQWRPNGGGGTPFQSPNEAGQYRARTEIAPDQRDKYVQRYNQVRENSNLLGIPPHLAGGKQFTTQQQNSLLQQFNSQSSQTGGVNNISATPPSPHHPNSIHQLTTQLSSLSSGPKDSDISHANLEDQAKSEDLNIEPVMNSPGRNNTTTEEDLNTPHPTDKTGPLTETVQNQMDLSPGQPLQPSQPSVNLGVIGRRSVPDLGAIGDNITPTATAVHDQFYNLQMLEAAYYKLPQPKDSERAKIYIPRHPVQTPPSYPQTQLPIFENQGFWERLGAESGWGTDALFFAFYYQQNSYQQYLAARELKKQSWRYHRKYNTWFQRHEEPKVTTDEYEQGTYVYFDFHTANDDLQQGWVQRIKTEFTFEYSYLEDELVV